MASNQKIIYVYESFKFTTPNFLGTLFVENVRGRESYSFEYDADWLKSSANYMYLDPDLQLYAGRQYPTGAKNVFGLFADSSPDRWGRLLMTRRERILAEQEGRKPRKLLDSDFLMGVYDETRMGAIRFKLDKDGPFLSDDSETPTPPWTSLRTLEEASRQFENDESGLEQKWINQLIKPGSSLGGARPKATVLDTKGNLWIAKFPSKHDDINVGAWEKVTHDLARLCGLDVPESMLIDFSKYHKNTLGDKKTGPVPGYHLQRVSQNTISGYLEYISDHDLYRNMHPLYPVQSKKNSPPPMKGTKRYRKEQKRAAKKARRQSIAHVLTLIENLDTQARVARSM